MAFYILFYIVLICIDVLTFIMKQFHLEWILGIIIRVSVKIAFLDELRHIQKLKIEQYKFYPHPPPFSYFDGFPKLQ